MQEYDFDVTRQPGRANVVADALSRAPVVMGEEPVVTSEAQPPSDAHEPFGGPPVLLTAAVNDTI